MQLTNTPGKLVLPFANAGAKNTIPTASQIGITAGAASLTDGFPPLTRTPIAAGGVPPSGLDMNGILYALSAALRWANAGGGYVYDGTFAADSNVGGYPKGARVLRSDGTGYWLNTIDGNTVDPESTTVNAAQVAGWVPDLTNGVAAITMTSANVTLTPAQYGKPVIVISGVLTANLNLIFPNLAGEWTVVNNCTGAFTVTAKTAAGTGIGIAIGRGRLIYGDGTDIYGAGSDSGQLIGVKVFAASGTYTATPGTKRIIVEAVGGGGAGGGAVATSSNSSVGGGGGGGCYAKVQFTSPPASAAVTVGAAGAGVAGGTGGPGGTTSFGALLSVGGGIGGLPSAAVSSYPASGVPSSGSGTYSTTGTALLVALGGPGSWGLGFSLGGNFLGGAGGQSYFGAGGNPTGTGSTGNASGTRGAGGAGACNSNTGVALAGGAGAAGLVIVWEYA